MVNNNASSHGAPSAAYRHQTATTTIQARTNSGRLATVPDRNTNATVKQDEAKAVFPRLFPRWRHIMESDSIASKALFRPHMPGYAFSGPLLEEAIGRVPPWNIADDTLVAIGSIDELAARMSETAFARLRREPANVVRDMYRHLLRLRGASSSASVAPIGRNGALSRSHNDHNHQQRHAPTGIFAYLQSGGGVLHSSESDGTLSNPPAAADHQSDGAAPTTASGSEGTHELQHHHHHHHQRTNSATAVAEASAAGAAASTGATTTALEFDPHGSYPPAVPRSSNHHHSGKKTREQLAEVADALAVLSYPGDCPTVVHFLHRQARTSRPALVCVPWRETDLRSSVDPMSSSSFSVGVASVPRPSKFSAAAAADAPTSPLKPVPGLRGRSSSVGGGDKQRNSATSSTAVAAAPGAAPGRKPAMTGAGVFTVNGSDDDAAFVPCLVVVPDDAQTVTLYCHGNAADLGMISHMVQAYAAACKTIVIAPDYPHYGVHQAGPHCDEAGTTPTEAGCVATALRVLRYILASSAHTLAAAAPRSYGDSSQGAGGDFTEISETLTSIGSPSIGGAQQQAWGAPAPAVPQAQQRAGCSGPPPPMGRLPQPMMMMPPASFPAQGGASTDGSPADASLVTSESGGGFQPDAAAVPPLPTASAGGVATSAGVMLAGPPPTCPQPQPQQQQQQQRRSVVNSTASTPQANRYRPAYFGSPSGSCGGDPHRPPSTSPVLTNATPVPAHTPPSRRTSTQRRSLPLAGAFDDADWVSTSTPGGANGGHYWTNSNTQHAGPPEASANGDRDDDGGAESPASMSHDTLGQILRRRLVTLDRVVLFGQSIGTGVVMQLLRLIRHGAVADLDPRRSVAAVVLHSPFTSVRAIMRGAEETDGRVIDNAIWAHKVVAADGTGSACASSGAGDSQPQNRHRSHIRSVNSRNSNRVSDDDDDEDDAGGPDTVAVDMSPAERSDTDKPSTGEASGSSSRFAVSLSLSESLTMKKSVEGAVASPTSLAAAAAAPPSPPKNEQRPAYGKAAHHDDHFDDDDAAVAATLEALDAVEEQFALARAATNERRNGPRAEADFYTHWWNGVGAALMRDRFRSIDVIAEAYDPSTPPLPPFLLVHGSADRLIPIQHSLLLAQAILRCPNCASRSPSGKLAVVVKPGGGHNDVLMLEEKAAFMERIVDGPLAQRYMAADGSPEGISHCLLPALDRFAVPHDVAEALTLRRRCARAQRYFALGCVGAVAAALCLAYGAIVLPVLAYAPPSPGAGHCRGSPVVAEFGVTSIAAAVRCAVSIALIAATNLGFEAFGIHTLPSGRAPAAILFHYIAQLLAGAALVAGVVMSALEARRFVLHQMVMNNGSGEHWLHECEWLFAVLPTLGSVLFGLYAAVTLIVAAVRHH